MPGCGGDQPLTATLSPRGGGGAAGSGGIHAWHIKFSRAAVLNKQPLGTSKQREPAGEAASGEEVGQSA